MVAQPLEGFFPAVHRDGGRVYGFDGDLCAVGQRKLLQAHLLKGLRQLLVGDLVQGLLLSFQKLLGVGYFPLQICGLVCQPRHAVELAGIQGI